MRRLDTTGSSIGGDDNDDGEIRRSLRSDPRIGKSRKTLAGCLRVRCAAASDLPIKGDNKKGNVFRALSASGSNDPYVQLTLTDDGKHITRRRTHTIENTAHPVWREEFKFGVRKKAKKLVLEANVFLEEAPPHEDVLQGVLRLELDVAKLEQEENDWFDLRGELSHPNSVVSQRRTNAACSTSADETGLGSLHLRLCWEPWRTRQVSKCLRALASSPRAANVAGTCQVFLAGFLALVEWQTRWLCTGASLAECSEVDVPGAAVCALIACVSLFASGSVQLAGSLDLLGEDWNGAPPHAFELLEDPDQDEERLPDRGAGGTVHVSMNPGMVKQRAYVGIKELRLCRRCKLGLAVLRWMAWTVKATSMSLCLLGASFAWLEKGEGDRFGEAVYLNVAVMVVLAGGCLSFVYGNILAREERHWTPMRRWKLRAGQSLKKLHLPLLFETDAGEESEDLHEPGKELVAVIEDSAPPLGRLEHTRSVEVFMASPSRSGVSFNCCGYGSPDPLIE